MNESRRSNSIEQEQHYRNYTQRYELRLEIFHYVMKQEVGYGIPTKPRSPQ